EKRFRQDLLYRLHDFGITVPPLRDCQEDIMPLAEFFREIANNELERDVKGFSASAQKVLNTYAWPGNVRELRQKVLTAVLQAENDMITEEDLEFGSEQITSPVGFTLKSEGEEKERIRRALKQAKDNKRLAAELLGISRATLYKKLKEYGMNEEN
uniref:helix-turn-helix domain-containing protein n=2 Tax=Bacteroides TaxID=816 RepID=UPI0035667233